ncbi:MAG: hypothetical protein IJ019_06275 [Alphaproteobacteria bacterium]|nr:hypothetical protein [Alphaproteobacteria bacterium]
MIPKEPKAKRLAVFEETLRLMRSKSVICPADVTKLFDRHIQSSYYGGPVKDYPTLYFEGSVKIAKIRAYDEYVPDIVDELGYETLTDIESTPVFIGVTKVYNEKCSTFVWVPLSPTVYVFKNEPFEVVQRPNLFVSKEVKEFELNKLEYNRGFGYYEPENKSYPIVQKNTLYRKFKINRYNIEAVEDRVFSQIEWTGLTNNRESLNMWYDPMWLLRHKPEEIAQIETTIKKRSCLKSGGDGSGVSSDGFME